MVHSWPCLGPFPPSAASSPVVTALPRARAGTGFGAGAAGPGVGGAAAGDPRVLPQPGPKARAELPGAVVSRAVRLVLHRGSSRLGLRHQKEASESLEGLRKAAWSRLVGIVLGRAWLRPSHLARCGQGRYLLRMSKASPRHCWARCVQTHTKALPQPALLQSRASPASLRLTCSQHSMPHVWSGPGGPSRSSPGPSVPGSSGRVGGCQAEATVGKVGQQAGKG